MRNLAFTCLVIAFYAASASAQNIYLKTKKEAKAKADQALNMIVNGESTAAFELLKPHWPISDAQVEELGETTARQVPLLESQFGKLKGQEFIQDENLGSFGYLVEYVIKYEKNALRFYILFYNGGDGWLINTLRWDDRWDLMFESTIKAAD